jgi:predicted metal-dependent hydrolase
MPEVRYGDQMIQYSVLVSNELKSHYIIVEKNHGVILKGALLSEERANKYILKKAKWILEKLSLVESVNEDDIVTGSRILYLGKKYYTEVYFNDSIASTKIEFNHSRFKITTSGMNTQQDIQLALDDFFKEKAAEKIYPRVEKWAQKTGLRYELLQFRKQYKRWGSCTPRNHIVINTDAVKLPYSLIDYLIVHELCHTKHKDHSKAFWAEVGKYLRNWKELDERMWGMKM